MQQHYPHTISSFCSKINLNHRISSSSLSSFSTNGTIFKFKFSKRKTRQRNRAIEKESEFEIDQKKAREALEKLDNQFQSLATKKTNTVKIRASEVKLERDFMMKEDEPEFTGRFLPLTALALFIFTIVYNVIFFKVIVPSVDGPVPKLSPPSAKMILSDDKYYAPLKSPSLLE